MISILVVEDDKIKRTAYNDIFNKLNIPIERIDCCESINSAKEKLYTRQYDVMILDLVLPRRTGDSVESSGGKDLLNEILEYSNHFHIPNNIFVVSAYEDPMLEFRECMNNTYFASIKYDSSCSAWHEQLSSYLSQILRTLNCDNLTYDYDTAIICALSDPELKQVRELPFDWKPYRHPGDITSYYTGNYNSKKLICAASYEMGMPAAAILASKMVLHFRPHYLIMTGIAGCAKSEELHFGDIMIADPCFDYGSGKKL